MKILLLGEFSRLHNSLKEGLEALGHEVTLVGAGDGFKNFPVDIFVARKWFKHPITNFIRKVIFRVFKVDLELHEVAYRFKKILPQLKDYDVVQLINEQAIGTTPKKEIALLKTLFQQNKKVFLLACGEDYTSINHYHKGEERYSILTPYLENKDLKKYFHYSLKYITKPYKALHDFIFEHCNGVIASDMDYHIPLKGHPKYLGLVPNPINIDILDFEPLVIQDKIRIFHGVNTSSAIKKGNAIIDEALQVIEKTFPNEVSIKTTYSLPYNEYLKANKEAHIIMDQLYGYDQGYNALEAMARGKVVFTGAEKEFEAFYKLDHKVAVNAIPDTNQIVEALTHLIQNKHEIPQLGKNARAFIEKEHHYIKVAKRYLDLWNGN